MYVLAYFPLVGGKKTNIILLAIYPIIQYNEISPYIRIYPYIYILFIGEISIKWNSRPSMVPLKLRVSQLPDIGELGAVFIFERWRFRSRRIASVKEFLHMEREIPASHRCKDRLQMVCTGSWIITMINSQQKMPPKRPWSWMWSRPTVAKGSRAAPIPTRSLLWLVWLRDRIKGDNGAWSTSESVQNWLKKHEKSGRIPKNSQLLTHPMA